MQHYTDSQRYNVKQRHTCTHCCINAASKDQQWCMVCVEKFEQWLQRDYCELCYRITVDKGETYCEDCSNIICLALVMQWENVMAGSGLY